MVATVGYPFHLMYLWVALVKAICSGLPEPTSTTVCLDYFNEIVPCISTCPSGQHLASHELVCDCPLRKCVVRQRCFEIKCAIVSHAAHAKAQLLCQEGTENSECDIECIEGYTIHFLDSVTCIFKIGYSLNGLRYGKKEFLLGCKCHGTYEVPHLTCEPINCTRENTPIAKMIGFSGEFLPSSSPVVLCSNKWLKYQCGEGHTLSGIPDSFDLFTMTCFDGDHTMTHCKSAQCEDPPVIAYATPLGDRFVTITYGKHVEYQPEAGYHVESERKSGSKPEGCHAMERAEQVQPPSHEWLEDWSCARCDEISQWAVLVTCPPGTGNTDGVRLLAGYVLGTFLECDMREVEGRKLAELILKGQGGLRQTSVAILNIDTDVTDKLKWKL